MTDHRGDIYNDDRKCAMFMAYTTPNSTIPDQLPTRQRQLLLLLPVRFDLRTGNEPAFNAARSFHAGGVNTLKSDGSVRFAKNSVNVATWRR